MLYAIVDPKILKDNGLVLDKNTNYTADNKVILTPAQLKFITFSIPDAELLTEKDTIARKRQNN